MKEVSASFIQVCPQAAGGARSARGSHTGPDIQLGQEVAIKLTHVRDGRRVLEGEVEMYGALAGGVGIPRVW